MVNEQLSQPTTQPQFISQMNRAYFRGKFYVSQPEYINRFWPSLGIIFRSAVQVRLFEPPNLDAHTPRAPLPAPHPALRTSEQPATLHGALLPLAFWSTANTASFSFAWLFLCIVLSQSCVSILLSASNPGVVYDPTERAGPTPCSAT